RVLFRSQAAEGALAGRLERLDAELVPDTTSQRAFRGLDIEANRSCGEPLGIDPADEDVGVGDGGLGTTAPITGRARLGTRAAREIGRASHCIDGGDRSAAGADLDELHDGEAPR